MTQIQTMIETLWKQRYMFLLLTIGFIFLMKSTLISGCNLYVLRCEKPLCFFSVPLKDEPVSAFPNCPATNTAGVYLKENQTLFVSDSCENYNPRNLVNLMIGCFFIGLAMLPYYLYLQKD